MAPKVYRAVWKDEEVALKFACTENYQDYNKIMEDVRSEEKRVGPRERVQVV